MASAESERSSGRPLPTRIAAPPSHEEPPQRKDEVDPYEPLVERLLALLEENRIAIATLAQAWRHTNRALQLTQAELAHTQERLAAEQQIPAKLRRKATPRLGPLP